MVRSTSFLLVVVMLLASGRLLACGWECIDELAAAPLVTVFVTQDPLTAPRYSIHSFRAPFGSPHSPAPAVLRI